MIVAYMRFSPRPREKVFDAAESMPKSFANQKHQIETFLKSRTMNGELQWVKDELVSARCVPLYERPGGAELSRLISQGCKHVVVAALDRLFRDMRDGLNVLEDWKKQKVTLHTCNGVSVDIGTATGTMLAQQLLCFAEFEPALISERTRNAKARQKAGNRRTSRHARFGYRFDENNIHPETGRPYLEIPDEVEKAILDKIVQWNADGLSLNSIARELNESSLFSPRRTRSSWNASFVKRLLLASD